MVRAIVSGAPKIIARERERKAQINNNKKARERDYMQHPLKRKNRQIDWRGQTSSREYLSHAREIIAFAFAPRGRGQEKKGEGRATDKQ